ncbi:MAG TPA: TlpA disulfide reductase family protein [Bryobacteraceae bacterium]|nr:TlpA disulfide reductase family protein [Bryobacteraceae bacterium]
MGSAKENQMLEAGARAPDFRLDVLDGGGQKSLPDLLSSGSVLLAFFKVSCPTCQLTLPFLERIHRGKAPVVAVSQDDAEATREFQKEFGITMPTLLDSARVGYPASNAYGLAYVPSLFLVERDGKISWSQTGFNRKQIEAIGRKFGVEVFQAGDSVPESKSG